MGERDYRIFVENLNHVANTLAVDILTSVVFETRQEGLRIENDKGGLLEGGSVLQFDKCYTGMPMSRQLRVKNTTVMAMDISLSSDRPGEVCVYILRTYIHGIFVVLLECGGLCPIFFFFFYDVWLDTFALIVFM